MGQRLYIVTSPQDVSAVYRNTATLTFDKFVYDIMLSVGTSEDAVRKMWNVPGETGSVKSNNKSQNGLHKALAHAGEDFYRQQLQPGELLDELWPKVQNLIDNSLLCDTLPTNCIASSESDSKKLSLWK